jgi:MFS family permease
VSTTSVERPESGRLRRLLFARELDHYPRRTARYWYLAVAVLATVVLYYVYFEPGAVTPQILAHYHMSFLYYLNLVVVANAVGAATSLIGGMSDRIGRANLVVYGLLVVGILQLAAIPNAGTKIEVSLVYVAIGFVEGIILVTTPALIRDFSPQMGRAAAMGFWALGPTVGSLAASVVANHTLTHLPAWQDQFIISGIVCLVVFCVAFFGLRDLSRRLRDQVMVSLQEQSLIEARARGIDVEAATAHPVRSMLHLDLVVSAFGISVFLLIYFAAVTVLTLYFAVVFNLSVADANGVNTWYWAFDSVFLVVAGLASDRLLVRKPFMVVGAVGAIVTTVVFLSRSSHPATGYYTHVLIVSLLGVFLATAYSPWMAAYTEAVESHNPALTATGLAIWAWILRVVVAVSFLVLPHVVTTASAVVDNSSVQPVALLLQRAGAYVTDHRPAPPDLIRSLEAIGPPGQALAFLIQQPGEALPPALSRQGVALVEFKQATDLVSAGKPVPPSVVAHIQQNSSQLGAIYPRVVALIKAQNHSPAEWRRWWWVCVIGQVVFLLIVLTMKGRWSPRAARADLEAHERRMDEELARLPAESAA